MGFFIALVAISLRWPIDSADKQISKCACVRSAKNAREKSYLDSIGFEMPIVCGEIGIRYVVSHFYNEQSQQKIFSFKPIIIIGA